MIIPPMSPARLRSLTIGATTMMWWAVAAASAVLWGLRLSAPPAPLDVPASALPPSHLVTDPMWVAKALGAVDRPSAAANVAPPPPAANRFALQGVIHDNTGRGVAIIAVDGKPARAVPVGSPLGDEGLVLQAVRERSVDVGRAGGAGLAFTLELPAKSAPSPSTGATPGRA